MSGDAHPVRRTAALLIELFPTGEHGMARLSVSNEGPESLTHHEAVNVLMQTLAALQEQMDSSE